MEYSIQEVAKAAGTTSRTLRHYDSIGLVRPSRIGHNGYRYYDDVALVRLQRVLLLRELGLGLEAIGDALDAQDARSTETEVLGTHLELLRKEQHRLSLQVAAVERTIAALTARDTQHTHERSGLMSENIFEGFDHTEYKEEVEERWGKAAYASGDAWWRGLGAAGQQAWLEGSEQLGTDWIEAAARGIAPESDEAQALASRHADWLKGIPGTPAHADPEGEGLTEYLRGLGELYVADDRFAANYGGAEGATFVRDALRVYADGVDAARARS